MQRLLTIAETTGGKKMIEVLGVKNIGDTEFKKPDMAPEEAGNRKMSRVKNRLEQYYDDYSKYSKYNAMFIGSALDMLEQLMDVLEQDEKENDWIPITEQLPRQGAYVLLSFENYLLPEIGFYEEDKKGGAFCNAEGYKFNSAGIFVNAWMPLPEPYKED